MVVGTSAFAGVLFALLQSLFYIPTPRKSIVSGGKEW